MSLISKRIMIKQTVISFSTGIGTISIDGAEDYGAAMVQNISSNDYVIYRAWHSLNSKQVGAYARKYDGTPLTGNLTVIILLLK